MANTLPTVKFCGLNVSRLILGANPFAGYSHQTPERDVAMKSYHTVERILETWEMAEAEGINTIITNNATPHVVQAVKQYLSGGGKLQWITQTNCREAKDMAPMVEEGVKIGAKAMYLHGGLVDTAFETKDAELIRNWGKIVRAKGIPAGVAGHSAAAHLWVDSLNAVDFHAVCFFNCGSLHSGKGDRFQLSDVPKAVDAIQRIKKPCIGYKIMGAGRIDPRMAFEYAFEHIKPTDVVNVGMHRGDKDDMVEYNAAMVREILGVRELVAA